MKITLGPVYNEFGYSYTQFTTTLKDYAYHLLAIVTLACIYSLHAESNVLVPTITKQTRKSSCMNKRGIPSMPMSWPCAVGEGDGGEAEARRGAPVVAEGGVEAVCPGLEYPSPYVPSPRKDQRWVNSPAPRKDQTKRLEYPPLLALEKTRHQGRNLELEAIGLPPSHLTDRQTPVKTIPSCRVSQVTVQWWSDDSSWIGISTTGVWWSMNWPSGKKNSHSRTSWDSTTPPSESKWNRQFYRTYLLDLWHDVHKRVN